jgi:hypothetical protein
MISVAAGATVLLGDDDFPEAKRDTTTIAPHVVVGADHSKQYIRYVLIHSHVDHEGRNFWASSRHHACQ